MLVSTAAAAFAQRAEFGGLIGGGAFAVSSGGAAGRGQAGVEVYLFCSGRLGIFGEFSQWFLGMPPKTPLAPIASRAQISVARGSESNQADAYGFFSMWARWQGGMSTLPAAEAPSLESWWARGSKFPGGSTGIFGRRSARMDFLRAQY